MADTEQEQEQKAVVEAQEQAEAGKGTETPQVEKPTGEATETSGDPFAMRQGEKPEDYATRMRNEASWRDKQMGRQYRKIKEADEKLAKMAEIEQQNRELQELATRAKPQDTPQTSRPQTQQPAKPLPSGVSPEALAQARMQVGMERLGEELNKRAEWPQAYRNLEQSGGVQPDLLSAVLDTDDPAHVMLKLGQDMNLYQQILDMPEGRRRAALVKLGMETAQTAQTEKPALKKPSGAPPPRQGLPPGDGAKAPEGSVDIYDPKLASDEHDQAWYAERVRQKRESQGRPWSPPRR
jgi:hypothetical protein